LSTENLPPFTVDVHLEGAMVAVDLMGELDYATVPHFTSAMARVASDHPATAVRINLGSLDFIDSSGMSALMSAHAATAARGAKLTVIRGPARVQRPLEVIGMEQILEFVDP
jgi:anti-sigma B factor antagonist